MASSHSYPLGAGREAEKDPAAARRRFLGKAVTREYEKIYHDTCQPLAALGIPFRMDETNSCWDGGAKGSSDTYASALWALDYLNWWAAHGIVGLNFHTGDTVNGVPPMAANYAAFVHAGPGRRLTLRPLTYALLAFSQSAHGHPLPVQIAAAPGLDFTAYAYREGTAIYVIALNKTAETNGRPIELTLHWPAGVNPAASERMDLAQAASDIAAKAGVSLAGRAIDADGHWAGKWTKLSEGSPQALTVSPATAALFRFEMAR